MPAKSDTQPRNAALDPEHELPETDAGSEPENAREGAPAETKPAGEAVSSEQDEIRRLLEERDRLNDRLLRSLADFDNYRKRMQKDLTEARSLALVEALRALLPVLDSFDRALAAGGGAEDLRKGVELMARQFQDNARRLGLEPIASLWERFDPHWHEAIEAVDREDVADNTVIEELQRGYRLKDRLVRPAMVKVARNSKA